MIDKYVIAKHYATALLDAAQLEGGTLPSLQQDLCLISSYLGEQKAIAALFLNRFVPQHEKEAIWSFIKEELKNRECILADITERFMQVLIEEHRTNIIEEISSALEDRRLAAANTAKAQVVLAQSVDEEYQRRITSVLSEVLGKELCIQYSVDPRILGGIIVSHDNNLLDLSLQRRLELITDYAIGEG